VARHLLTAELEASAVARAKEGDTDAFGELVTTYQRPVFLVMLLILKNPADAEDATMEAFERAWTALAGFRAESSFKTWLFRIATNRALERMRAPRAAVVPVDHVEPSIEVDYGSNLDLLNALGKLSDEERHIVIAHVLGGELHKEIAAELHMNPNTVRVTYCRALLKLRKELTK